MMECEVEGYPCTWGEVREDAARRTDQVGQIAAALMKAVGDPHQVAEVLAAEIELAELQVDDLAIRFRLPDSRPAWIPTPYDPRRPRRGGSSFAGTGQSGPVLSQMPGFLATPVLAQQAADRNNVAGSDPGAGKKALILAPFYYELGHEVAAVYDAFINTRDFKSEHGGSVVMRANLHSSRPNDPVRLRDDGVKSVSGQVTVQEFIGWDAYDFVYLATHGYAVCPDEGDRAPQIAAGTCHTSISVRDFPGGADGLRQARAERPGMSGLWNLPGVDPGYKTVGTAHPGLSPSEARACLRETDRSAVAPGTTKPCFVTEEIPTEVSVSTEFFRRQYPGGFNDIVIFLAVCEALKADDLERALAPPGNHDVAVFGFEEEVDSYVARVLGTKAVDLFVKGFDSAHVRSELTAEAARLNVDFFEGIVRGEEGDSTTGPAIGSISEASSNPTHARDIVELIDPETGEEVERGAELEVRGCPGDGKTDEIVVHPAVIGVDSPADLGGIQLVVSIDGGETGETYRPESRLEEGKYASMDLVSLGRDAREEETVDLEIRGELPRDGHSQWRYENVRLVASGPCPCTFTATVSGDSRRGSVRGEWAVFSTRGQASMMGASVDQGAVLEDLVGAMKMMQGLPGIGDDERSAHLLEQLEKKAGDARSASPGGTLGINLVEGGLDGAGPGLGGAFKIDVLVEGSIEPGFSGTLPVARASIHTGEFAADGGAPMIYLLDKTSKDHQGNVTLTVHDYDGEFLEGTLAGEMTGLAMVGDRRARIRFTAEFDAGVHNPLRMENACLMAHALADEE